MPSRSSHSSEPRRASVTLLRDALEALDWVRRELLRVQAPDQMRNGLRERAVQKLCEELIRGRGGVTKKAHLREKERQQS